MEEEESYSEGRRLEVVDCLNEKDEKRGGNGRRLDMS